jgi:hypothetical protein
MKKITAFISHADNLKILLGIALLFRLVLIPNPSFEADITFWKSWGLAVRDFGIVKGLPLTNFNYPTPFAYILALMVHIYSFFADPHNYNEFWTNTNVIFLAIAKAFPIIADFGIFGIFVWLGKNTRRIGFPEFKDPNSGNLTRYIYTLFGLIYLFNPLSLFDGALWGQVDSVGILLFLIANCFVWKKKPFLAGVIYMVAMMTKLQNMIYGPVFFLFIWQYLGFEGLLAALGGATTTFFALNIEFVLSRNMSRVIGDLTGNYDYFPWLSLNAYNVWWIFSGAHGMPNSDKVMAIGMTNAKTTGLFLFSSTYLLAILTMIKGKFLPRINVSTHQRINETNADTMTQRRADAEIIFRYLTGLIIAASAFFLFQTESHDRYAFPICVFLLLWVPFYWNPDLRFTIYDLRIKKFFIMYFGFTIIYFYNLHNALIQNYPKNGILFLNGLNTPAFTIIASYIQIGLFFYFLYVVRRYITPLLFMVWIGAFAGLLILSNSALILKKPVAITKLAPMESATGYGRRQVDMPVMAVFGFDKWGSLSDQYVFYKHGIGTHAPSREVFDINRTFTKLTTDFGVDTNGGPQGSVQFMIYGDRKLLFSSPIMKRYEFPRHADVNITGVKTLELIINDGGNGNIDDHADWLNTYLIP